MEMDEPRRCAREAPHLQGHFAVCIPGVRKGHGVPNVPPFLLDLLHISVLLESSQAAGSARGRLLQSTLRLHYRLFRGVTTFNM